MSKKKSKGVTTVPWPGEAARFGVEIIKLDKPELAAQLEARMDELKLGVFDRDTFMTNIIWNGRFIFTDT